MLAGRAALCNREKKRREIAQDAFFSFMTTFRRTLLEESSIDSLIVRALHGMLPEQHQSSKLMRESSCRRPAGTARRPVYQARFVSAPCTWHTRKHALHSVIK